ncbi:DUF805 domain-containing protein [Flavobacterium wongokense]|uniref:DUF805 domain-containing protein n=1 Tax=Flavobacterium wongokense TaxID=2910674 RepID=UPI001F41D6BA|nr:DUF805 domain-containing protein [Flavobacterium sp. WG47]MCF6131669.1 DUF805 domain-containing protein [Flavobacterium sp. WG47]
MINWYKKVVFENYANFNGRARRSEYWYFFLMYFIILIVATMADGGLGLNFAPMPYGYIYTAVGLIHFIPSLAAAVRRLHDVGKSGWFILIALIPIVGAIWLLVLLFTEGNRGENKYGPDPKAIGELAS